MTMPSPTVTPRTTLGAYALGPSPDLDDGRADAAFYDGLAELTTTDGHGIDALELPLDPRAHPGWSSGGSPGTCTRRGTSWSRPSPAP